MSKELDEAKVALVLNLPFFGRLLMELETVLDENLETIAAVSTRKLILNPKLFDPLPFDQRVGVLAHEVMHPALGHHWRGKWRDPERWNRAGDYVINLILADNKIVLPEGVLMDRRYAGLSTEEVYSQLEKKEQKGGGVPDKSPLRGDVQKNEPDPKTDGEGDDPNGNPGGSPAQSPSGSSATQEEQDQTRWATALSEAMVKAKTWGKLPAGLQDWIEDIVEPELSWDRLLALYANEISKKDFSPSQFDHRFLEDEIYLPDMGVETVEAVIALDTSGSISQEDLKKFLAEARAILNSASVSRIRLITCDAEIGSDCKIEAFDPEPTLKIGRGGTRFEPVFEALEKTYPTPRLLLYFTDLCGSFPDNPPPYPVLWIVVDGETKAPFGQVFQYRG